MHTGSKKRVLVLGGSIRARLENREQILDLANGARDLSEYIEKVSACISRGQTLSNSEIIAGGAILGAVTAGCDVDYFPLVHLFPPREESVFELKIDAAMTAVTKLDTLEIASDAFNELTSVLQSSQGVVLSTPVYFGDRSSVANKFMQICSVSSLLRDKIFGMVSVGAKRNGGQETTDIFGLYEALSQGSFVVGNGPPTSQYGGTALGGNVGHVLEDRWGLETAVGTGKRVAEVARILGSRKTEASDGKRIKIAVLVTMDTDRKMLRNYIDGLLRQASDELPWVDFIVEDVIDHRIYRCLGCVTCPKSKGKEGVLPHCVIKDPTDYLERVRKILNTADGAIVAGLNIFEAKRIIFRYQVLMERMRFIRRNDFELTNLLMTGLCYHQFGAMVNPIHSLKTMVSYIRHNTIIHQPIDIYEHNGTLLDSGLSKLINFCRSARNIKVGKDVLSLEQPVYEPHGEMSGYEPIE